MAHVCSAPAPTVDAPERADLDDLAAQLAATTDPCQRGAARDRLVMAALPLADSIARRYGGRGLDLDDLIQVARTGLLLAVHRYRPQAGSSFAAFASPTIAGEVKRHFRDLGWAVRPPRRLQELRPRISAAEERLRQDRRRHPTDPEVANELGVSPRDVALARAGATGWRPISLDIPAAAGQPLGEQVLVDEGFAAHIETRDALRTAIDSLTPRQRELLHMRFVEEQTQSQMGDRLGVSQMQVSRLLRSVLDHLRAEVFPAGE